MVKKYYSIGKWYYVFKGISIKREFLCKFFIYIILKEVNYRINKIILN